MAELAFDETDAEPEDIMSMLAIPKSLDSLRWTQEHACYSLGSCRVPYYDALGESLAQHRDTLKNLDLNIRLYQCDHKGHPGNPYARKEDMIKTVRDSWRDDCYLLGSLRDFSALKTLKLNPQILCGDKVRGAAPSRMIDSLPPSLEELVFYFQFSTVREMRNKQIGEQVWIMELANLIQNSTKEFPKLRKVSVLEYNQQTTDEYTFRDVQTACAEAGIDFITGENASTWQTDIPYFLEILPTRNPGRDF